MAVPIHWLWPMHSFVVLWVCIVSWCLMHLHHYCFLRGGLLSKGALPLPAHQFHDTVVLRHPPHVICIAVSNPALKSPQHIPSSALHGGISTVGEFWGRGQCHFMCMWSRNLVTITMLVGSSQASSDQHNHHELRHWEQRLIWAQQPQLCVCQ
jgi:hypothetical protein